MTSTTQTATGISHYTTRGSVRGTCGHRHQRLDTAVRCLLSDQRGCREQSGGGLTRSYSDRRVMVVYRDGTEEPYGDGSPEWGDDWQEYCG